MSGAVKIDTFAGCVKRGPAVNGGVLHDDFNKLLDSSGVLRPPEGELILVERPQRIDNHGADYRDWAGNCSNRY